MLATESVRILLDLNVSTASCLVRCASCISRSRASRGQHALLPCWGGTEGGRIGAAGASAAGDCRLQARDVLYWAEQYISVTGGIPRCRRSAC